MDLRRLRLGRGWSQEHLAEVSGLSVRTIQRIENGGQPGLASLAALRRVFGSDVDHVAVGEGVAPVPVSFLDAVRTCLTRYAEFDGRSGRPEYWWFVLFVTLTVSAAALANEALGGFVLLAWLLPLLAAGARRLRDAARSPWWQLLALVPFGVVVPVFMLTFPSEPLSDPVPGRLG